MPVFTNDEGQRRKRIKGNIDKTRYRLPPIQTFRKGKQGKDTTICV